MAHRGGHDGPVSTVRDRFFSILFSREINIGPLCPGTLFHFAPLQPKRDAFSSGLTKSRNPRKRLRRWVKTMTRDRHCSFSSIIDVNSVSTQIICRFIRGDRSTLGSLCSCNINMTGASGSENRKWKSHLTGFRSTFLIVFNYRSERGRGWSVFDETHEIKGFSTKLSVTMKHVQAFSERVLGWGGGRLRGARNGD